MDPVRSPMPIYGPATAVGPIAPPPPAPGPQPVTGDPFQFADAAATAVRSEGEKQGSSPRRHSGIGVASFLIGSFFDAVLLLCIIGVPIIVVRMNNYDKHRKERREEYRKRWEERHEPRRKLQEEFYQRDGYSREESRRKADEESRRDAEKMADAYEKDDEKVTDRQASLLFQGVGGFLLLGSLATLVGAGLAIVALVSRPDCNRRFSWLGLATNLGFLCVSVFAVVAVGILIYNATR
jgi:hypothetical protein